MYCVYLFQHKENHKIYIGRTKDFQKRLSSHVRTARSLRAHKTYFSKALAKYGLDSFDYFIIEEFDDFYECCQAEKFWISYFQSNRKDIGYNLSEGGETNKGVTPSAESIFKNRLANLGKHSIPCSPLAKLKISITKKINGTHRGSKHHNTNLTENLVAKIKGLLLQGRSSKFIINEYKLTKMIVSHIKSGRSWSHVQPNLINNVNEHTNPPNIVLRGSQHPSSKLTELQVIEIKKLILDGIPIANIARQFNVTWGTIKSIKIGSTWSHIKI